LPSLRLLADMNISPKTVASLQHLGWDIVRVSQILPANASDQQILDLARQEDRVVITQDLDFSTLLALGGHHRPSLVTLRLSTSDPQTVTQQLSLVLVTVEQNLQDGCAVTVEDTTVRIRKLPIK
jgi:predicted nuclease of predicted toxin-antitoxin system